MGPKISSIFATACSFSEEGETSPLHSIVFLKIHFNIFLPSSRLTVRISNPDTGQVFIFFQNVKTISRAELAC